MASEYNIIVVKGNNLAVGRAFWRWPTQLWCSRAAGRRRQFRIAFDRLSPPAHPAGRER
jgi:hypothetical protein